MFHPHLPRWRAAAWRAAALVPLVLLAAAGSAGELRKCVLADGRRAYVSDACPAGSREVWQRGITPDPGNDAALKRRHDEIARWEQASRQEAALRLRRNAVARSGVRAPAAATSPCERARQRRDRIRDREWMRMTYERMVRLDQDVADACR